jgi:hypothetical protein
MVRRPFASNHVGLLGWRKIADALSETRSISVNVESRSSPADSTSASFWRGKDMLYFPAKICFNPQLKP